MEGTRRFWIPCVEVESLYGTRQVELRTSLLSEGSIFLTGPINSDVADAFFEQILTCEKKNIGPITIYVDSPGGEVNAGLMIYDIIQSTKLDIDMICTGRAASMAAIILAGGQKGRRFILPHSEVMIHEPLISDGVGGSATSIKTIADSILEKRKLLNSLLAKHTGKSLREVDKATSYDHYMTAREAVDFGIADKIVETIR